MADSTEKRIESPLDLDNPTAVAFLRWVQKDFLDELADDDSYSDDERAKLAHYAGGFTQAADLLAVEPDNPMAFLLLGFAWEDFWDDYQEHLAELAAVRDVEEPAADASGADQ